MCRMHASCQDVRPRLPRRAGRALARRPPKGKHRHWCCALSHRCVRCTRCSQAAWRWLLLAAGGQAADIAHALLVPRHGQRCANQIRRHSSPAPLAGSGSSCQGWPPASGARPANGSAHRMSTPHIDCRPACNAPAFVFQGSRLQSALRTSSRQPFHKDNSPPAVLRPPLQTGLRCPCLQTASSAHAHATGVHQQKKTMQQARHLLCRTVQASVSTRNRLHAVPLVPVQHLDEEVAQMLLEGAKVPVLEHASHARLQRARTAWLIKHASIYQALVSYCAAHNSLNS